MVVAVALDGDACLALGTDVADILQVARNGGDELTALTHCTMADKGDVAHGGKLPSFNEDAGGELRMLQHVALDALVAELAAGIDENLVLCLQVGVQPVYEGLEDGVNLLGGLAVDVACLHHVADSNRDVALGLGLGNLGVDAVVERESELHLVSCGLWEIGVSFVSEEEVSANILSMTLCDAVGQEGHPLCIGRAVGINVERFLLAVLLYVVLGMRNSEDNLGRILHHLAELYFLYSAGLVLACNQSLVVEDKEFVDVFYVSRDGDFQVVQHLVVQHGGAEHKIGLGLLSHRLHLRKINCVSHTFELV